MDIDLTGLVKAGAFKGEVSPVVGFFDKTEETVKVEKKNKPQKKDTKNEQKRENADNCITIDDFAKVELKVGKILRAEKVEKADKLLKFTVRVGEEERTIVSGIAKYYDPAELIGKNVAVVANLKPAKLRGIESQGMLLCAEKGDQLELITIDTIDDGGRIR